MRRARPNPCCGPSACSVLRIIRSSVPWSTSDRGAFAARLDMPKNHSRSHMQCPMETARVRSARFDKTRSRGVGPTHTITQPRADVLVVMEDIVGVVGGLHVHQPVVDSVAVRLADPA